MLAVLEPVVLFRIGPGKTADLSEFRHSPAICEEDVSLGADISLPLAATLEAVLEF